jgi:hypothetical protein
MNCTRILTTAVACAVVGLTGCGDGGGDTGPTIFTSQILSDSSFDGDIEQTDTNSFTVTQGMSATVQTVLAGIDPGAGTEFRAFLDFPLGGSGGVPGNAVIDSATLEIIIDDLQANPSNASLPLLIELVSFQPPNLSPSNFDRGLQPALASLQVSPPITQTNVGKSILIDVTSLMVEAQRRGLQDFQVRIMEDLGVTIDALMAIDDTTGADRAKFAPLLTVNYF